MPATRRTQKEHTDDTDRMPNVQGPRNSKKRKTSNEKPEDASNGGQPMRSRTKGKKGNLKFANDVPFDVLLEIFRLLEPIDLLHLSRVSKSLHASLTSNEMIPLWHSAYKLLQHHGRYSQPPFCPDDTNIVFYTDFLYGRHCQFCASIYGRIYHESSFIRLCLKCANKSFLALERGDPVYQLCNRWTFPKCKGLKTSQTAGVLKGEHDLRLKEFKQAHKAKKAESYIKTQTSAVKDRLSIASRLSEWRRGIRDEQIRNLEVIRKKRGEDVKNKIEEEGFKADFDRICVYNWADHVPHARKPHPLTDSEWSLIRADILDFFQNNREERAIADQKSEFHSLIANLKRFIRRWKIHPTAWWIASSEPIASFMKNGSEKISMKNFEGVEVEIRNLITSWQEETDRYLATLIPRPSRKGKKNTPNGDTIGLELATTFFKCHFCTEPIGYPRILMHGCLLSKNKEDENNNGGGDIEDDEDEVVNPRTRARGPRQPRPPIQITPGMVFPMLSEEYSLGMVPGKAGVKFDKKASNSARDIITVCGEDPNTVTYAQMEGLATRLECLRCSRAMQEMPETESTRLVMKWNMAVIHGLEEHHGERPSSEPAWGKIDSREDLDTIEGEESYLKVLQKHQYQVRRVSCNHCSSSWHAISVQEQLYHIKWQHKESGVDEANVSQHFSSSMDISIRMLYPAIKI